MFKRISLLTLLLFNICEAKVLIITHAYNRPEFIEIQHQTFKKFLQDDYTFVVFNDATSPELCEKIQTSCTRLSIPCIKIPQEIHDRPYLHRRKGENYHHPSVRTANVVQYSLDVLGFEHDGLVAIVDSDLFLIRPLSLTKLMEGYDLAGVPQKRGPIDYIWNGIVFFNMNTLPERHTLNFNCGKVKGHAVDTAGHTYDYLHAHPNIKLLHLDTTYIGDDHAISPREKELAEVASFLEKKPNNVEFFADYAFLHYRSGANWDRKSDDYHQTKKALLSSLITSLLAEK
jgi:hypothetical protein